LTILKKERKKNRLRAALRLVLWVLLVQFVLINVSAALYAYKFTHLYPAEEAAAQSSPGNFFSKTWYLFSGPRYYKLPCADKPNAYDSISLKANNDLSIEAWYAKWNTPDSFAYGTVILFHGLMGNKSTVLHQAEQFRGWGFNVLLLDARAHGHSGGTITTIGYQESEEVKLAYDLVKARGDSTIFLWGFSMGAVQIMKAVADHNLKPAGIILEMPFLSLQSHIKNRIKTMGFPGQPFGFFITSWIGLQAGFNTFSFNTLTYAEKINSPVLLQYGSRDQLVKPGETETIYRHISSKDKKLVVYDDANHESFLQKDPALWRKEVSMFLEKFTF
jgi:alpha-beta hydrolase superfamily lysophospholipase